MVSLKRKLRKRKKELNYPIFSSIFFVDSEIIEGNIRPTNAVIGFCIATMYLVASACEK